MKQPTNSLTSSKKLADHAGNGLNLSLLKAGTKLTVHTRKSTYDLMIVEGKLVTVFGGTLPTGLLRFPVAREMIVSGSSLGGSSIRVDWVGVGLKMEIINPTTKESYVSSTVRAIVVEAPDGSWNYRL